MRQLKVSLFGAVQGVGFRPFVYRLASEMKLSGWVLNGPAGLVAAVEGEQAVLKRFLQRLEAEKPPAAQVAAVETVWLEPEGFQGFEIRESREEGARSAWVLPDLATCPACLAEVLAPRGRRRGYPFTNCTDCGPRFTLVTRIPYDRPNTTMAGFPLCADCEREYRDPADRRFHAQPIACPACGPRLWLEEGERREEGGAALEAAARRIEAGGIVAMKGIGGFLLLCDARSSEAVLRLRARKRRREKPFAVLFPTRASVRRACVLSKAEEGWLRSAAAPIVLLRRRAGKALAEEVAPGNDRLGAMLPYAPLHHLLCRRLGFPVVATSGNLSEEPIATDNDEARERLGGLADAFLMHDRPIARHADDSIVRLSRGRQSVLRRARGLAPMPLHVPGLKRAVLALGAHLKNTAAAAFDERIVLTQHLGDLEAGPAFDAFRKAVEDLRSLYGFRPELAACDLHPDYLSTRFAEGLGLPLVRVQHHHAHVASCLAEQGIPAPVLGVSWDGIGLGPDGTLWGGEFLRVDESGWRRLAHLRLFPLPGGEAAVREPRRAALGALSEAGLDVERLKPHFSRDWGALRRLPASKALSPRTSSAGRLFDAAASLRGLRQVNAFEGQAAMALEHAAAKSASRRVYPFTVSEGAPAVIDWAPALAALMEDGPEGPAAFHNTLARMILEVARRAGLERVVLTGGVFQNALLSERAAALLERAGHKVYTHQRLPCNDGGISAGQAFLASRGWGTEPCA
ncbi:MAG TPA: carbamoyltransferase HypF [Elusimicrobia bacterium]|nr:carbamoyltransferase HypF [Elusimicrobiota bacterium]